jgi:Arc/MetJ family transcription regulator
MKRTNLVLDGDLLEEATRVLGVKTYSAAVNLALGEVLRIKKIQSLPGFFGRVQWDGELSEMRGDAPDDNRLRRTQRPTPKAATGKRRRKGRA